MDFSRADWEENGSPMFGFNKTRNFPEFRPVFNTDGDGAALLETKIHNDDEMFLFEMEITKGNAAKAAQTYFTHGARTFNLVREILEWKFGSVQNTGTFLDFASGYGRVTRFLSRVLPPKRVWVADIYKGGVAFQKKTFGVRGVISTTDPSDFECAERFDCIFVASLFSHLPGRTFTRWLKRLHRLLKPEGILVFTVHGAEVMPKELTMPESGILFVPHSESRSLDREEYGATWVTERYVRDAVEFVTENGECCRRIPRGLCDFQDVYIVPQSGEEILPQPGQFPTLRGNLDVCQFSKTDQLFLAGWAADLKAGSPSAEVVVRIDGKTVARENADTPRPDVAAYFRNPEALNSGWSITLPWKWGPESMISVMALRADGTEFPIAFNGVEHLLTQPPVA